MVPRTAWQAIAQRPLGFLATSWPWRALAYLASGVLIGVATAAVLAALVAAGLLLLVFVVGALAFFVIALSGIGVARLERRRLRLVDLDPAPNAHLPPSRPGLAGWLSTRVREQITWRELGFTALSLLALWWLDLGVLMFAFGAPIVLIRSAVLDPSVWPWAVVGIALIPAAPFTITLWAAARGSLTRAVLAPRDTELGRELTEVQQSRARLVAAFDNERTRIERDLHDGAQQRLASLRLSIGLLRLDAPPESDLQHKLGELQEEVGTILTELRDLARGVRPQTLTDRGLPDAVDDLASRFVLPVATDIAVPRLPPDLELTAYYIIAESLANVAKHSEADSATVRARCESDLLVLQIRDNGVGGADPEAGSGLTGLADRIAALDGRMRVSSPPGGPTLMQVELPCRIT